MSTTYKALMLVIISLFGMVFPSFSIASSTVESTVSLWNGEHNTYDTLSTNDGITQGSLDYTNGKLDSGFLFDGNSGLEIPHIEGFSPTNFTIHMWIRPDINQNVVLVRPIVAFGNERGGTSVSILPSGKLCARIEWRHGGCSFTTGVGLFKNDQLAHLAIVKAGGEMRLYKNGVLVAGGNGTCCSKIKTSIYIGDDTRIGGGYQGMMDEIQYHDRALTDEEIFELYTGFLLNNPNPELEAELAEAYALIESLQTQIDNLTVTNAELEDQIITLESQNTIYITQILELEAKLDQLEQQVDLLEDDVEYLEDKVSGLEMYIDELQDQIKHLKDTVSQLEDKVAYLEDKVNQLQAELNNLKQLITSSISLIEEDFRATFKDPGFVIFGNTPEDQLENLVQSILNLNKGRKMGLYKQLR